MEGGWRGEGRWRASVIPGVESVRYGVVGEKSSESGIGQ